MCLVLILSFRLVSSVAKILDFKLKMCMGIRVEYFQLYECSSVG